MVVIRDNESNLESLIGSDWEKQILTFSRIIGFTFEKDEGEVKIELNPDRPDMYSILSIHNAMLNYNSLNRKEGTITPLNMTVREETVPLRPYLGIFTVNLFNHDYTLNFLRKDFLEYSDKLSETIGKQRKKFAVGVHDIDEIHGPITYTMNKGDVLFKTFDGMEGTLLQLSSMHEKGKKYGNSHYKAGIIALEDKEGIISVPPMFNSFRTRVNNTTTSFLIDITATSERSLKLACKLLMGYFVSKGIDIKVASTKSLNASTVDKYKEYVTINLNNLQKLSGIQDIQTENLKERMFRMGYTYTEMISGRSLRFSVPLERVDVMGEVDLIEDFLKAYGFTNITENVMNSALIGSPSPMRELESDFRYILASANFQEVKSFILSNDSSSPSQMKIMNPKSEDYSTIRDTLFHGLMNFLEMNRAASYPQKLFEVGEVIKDGNQETRVACLSCGQDSSYSEIKGVLDMITRSTGIELNEMTAADDSHFIRGRCAKFISSSIVSEGIIGEINPIEIVKHQLSLPVSYLEFSISI